MPAQFLIPFRESGRMAALLKLLGTAIAKLVIGAAALVALLAFALLALWPPEKIYLVCSDKAAGGQTLGFLYERFPPYALWAHSAGVVFVEGPMGTILFLEVNETDLGIYFRDSVREGHHYSGEVSKLTAEIDIRLADGSNIEASCRPSPFDRTR